MNAPRWLVRVGEVLLSLIFLTSIWGKITNWSGTVGWMQSLGIPAAGFLMVVSFLIEVVGTVLLLTGFRAGWGAVLLIVFLVPVTLLIHGWWKYPEEQQMTQQIMFFKNLAIIGAMLLVMVQHWADFDFLRKKEG